MNRLRIALILSFILIIALSFCAKKEVTEEKAPSPEIHAKKKEAPIDVEEAGPEGVTEAPAPERAMETGIGGAPETTEETTGLPSEEERPYPKERKIILTAYMTVEVDNAFKSKDEAIKIVKEAGGWIAGQNLTVNEYSETSDFTLTFKVPPEKFEQTLEKLSKLGEEKARQVTAEDVTLKHADIEARLSNARTYEERLLELAGRAGSIEELLEVEEQISYVREEIESYTAQLRALRELEANSTIHLTLSEQMPSRTWVFLREIGGLFSGGLAALVKILFYIIVVMIVLIPLLIIGFLIYRLIVVIIHLIPRGKKEKQ